MRILIVLLIFTSTTLGQTTDLVEQVMATYPSQFEDVKDLARRIHYDFKTDQQRVEAAYIWIVNNIRYDYDMVYGQKPKYVWIRYRTQEEKLQKQQQAADERINDILRVKSTLCYGYSNLFNRLCQLMEIKAVTINGYTKRSTQAIGKNEPFKNHSWNAVYLDNKWRLFDLTWASGFTDNTSGRWRQNRNDFYFDTDPQALISTHLPADPMWQLLNKAIKNETFFDSPICYPSYYDKRFVLDPQEDGLLNLKGRGVSITFSSLPTGSALFYSVDGSQDIFQVDRIRKTKTGDYRVEIFGINKNTRQLTLFSDLKPTLDFKLL